MGANVVLLGNKSLVHRASPTSGFKVAVSQLDAGATSKNTDFYFSYQMSPSVGWDDSNAGVVH